ncbi:hypothetical protein [Curtobacterium pusillum]|uniref:hypothetical protein n=1 Tax=Curtobacterium pusillum TaxID=69373 RepID=UPI0011A4C13B|nr:hypothetical protein [Curtobacterium pusillum]
MQQIAALETEWATADMNAERLVDMYDDPHAGDHLRQRQAQIRHQIAELAVRAGIGYEDDGPER